jgi:ribosomal protein S27AE
MIAAVARGNFCPNCGTQAFHAQAGVFECSSCGAMGWLGYQRPGPGSGKGSQCQAKDCGRYTLRSVGQIGSTELKYCSSCDAIVVV